MFVTPAGTNSSVRPLPQKAPPAIVVTLLGIDVPAHPTIKVLSMVFIIALQSFRLSKTGLSSATTIELKLGQ